MKKDVSAEMMKVQSETIDLCMEAAEAAGADVDEVFVYLQSEDKTRSYDVFYRVKDKICTKEELRMPLGLILDLMKEGNKDINRFRKLFKKADRAIPTEIRMIYNAKNNHFAVRYGYEPLTAPDGSSKAERNFQAWLEETRQNGSSLEAWLEAIERRRQAQAGEADRG